MFYVLLIYVLPVIVVARLALSFAHRLSSMLYHAPPYPFQLRST